MSNYTRRIIVLVILLVSISVWCTGCRHSPLLERIVYKQHVKQINLDNSTQPKEADKENITAVPKEINEQNTMRKETSTEKQGLGQADAQQDTIEQGAGDIEYSGGAKSGDGAMGQVVSDQGKQMEVPESVANVTTVCQDTKSPHWKRSRISNRSRYAGEWNDGMFDGLGTYNWVDGDTYAGEWEDDLFAGQGTYTWANGDQYTGEWKDDMFNGQGTYTWASGSSYAGEWKDGVKEGQGTYTWANGDKYVGEWKAGVKDGQGTYTWADDSVYTGEWKYGVREGRGTYKGADGTTYAGPWSNDKFGIK